MKKTIAIILFFLLALAFAGAGGYYFWKIKGGQKIVISSEDIVSNGKSLEDSDELKNDKLAEEENKDAANPAETDEKKVDRKKPNIISKNVSFGFQVASSRKIDSIIIHSSYNALGGDKYDVDKLIDEYKKYQVSPHYLIDRNGQVYRLVDDKNIAFHAGEGKMPDGREGINDFSIGIELMNDEDDDYTEEQYDALYWLIDALIVQYHTKYILGHKEIAPGRKTDPWNFDWKKFNERLKQIN